MEVDDVVGVVRRDGFRESHRPDLLPVGDTHAAEPREADVSTLVGHEDVEVHGAGRRRVAGLEHVRVEFVAEVEAVPFDPPLSRGHLQHHVVGAPGRHVRGLAELGNLVQLAHVRHLVETEEVQPGAQHDEHVDPAAIAVDARHVHELDVIHVVGAHAAEIFLDDDAGGNERILMTRIHRRIHLHPEADRAPLAAHRLVAVGREPADRQTLRALLVEARVRVVGRDLPRAEDADAVGRENPPESLAVFPPAQVRMRIDRPGRGLPQVLDAVERPGPRVADCRSEHRQRPGLLPAGAAAIGILEEGLPDLRVARALVSAVLVGRLLLAVEFLEIEIPLLAHFELLATSASARSLVTFMAACM